MNPILLIALGIVGFYSATAYGSEKKVDNTNEWTRFDELFHRFGIQYGIEWKWLKAICIVESNLGRAKSVARGLASPSDVEGSKSSDGKSWGIMQVTLTTGRDLDPACSVEKLNSPEYSVRLAALYLSQLLRRFSGDQKLTIMSYNQGPGNTAKGKTYAAGYYDKFLVALASVK